MSKILIFRQLKTKFGNNCIGFFQTRKLTIYKMTSARKSYTSKFVKKYNTSLLPAEKFRIINLYQRTVLLKIIYNFRIEISFMEKYKFLISKKLHQIYIFNWNNAFLWDCMGKSTCIKKMVAVRNYSTNTIMEKTNRGEWRGEG